MTRRDRPSWRLLLACSFKKPDRHPHPSLIPKSEYHDPSHGFHSSEGIHQSFKLKKHSRTPAACWMFWNGLKLNSTWKWKCLEFRRFKFTYSSDQYLNIRILVDQSRWICQLLSLFISVLIFLCFKFKGFYRVVWVCLWKWLSEVRPGSDLVEQTKAPGCSWTKGHFLKDVWVLCRYANSSWQKK